MVIINKSITFNNSSNPWKKKLVVEQVAPNSSAQQRLTIVRWKRLHGYMAIHAMSTWEKDECLLHEQK
jgi:hypothetical protein